MQRTRSNSPQASRPLTSTPSAVADAAATRRLRRTHPAAQPTDMPRLAHAVRKLLRELHTEPVDLAIQRDCWTEITLACPRAGLNHEQMPRNAHDCVELVLALMTLSDPVAQPRIEALMRCLEQAMRHPAGVLDFNALDDSVMADFMALGGLQAFAIERAAVLPPVTALITPPLLSETGFLHGFADLSAVCLHAPDAEALDLRRWPGLRLVLVVNPENPRLAQRLQAPPACQVVFLSCPGDAFAGHEPPVWRRLSELGALMAPLRDGAPDEHAALYRALAGQLTAPSRTLSLRDVPGKLVDAFAERGGMVWFTTVRDAMQPPLSTLWLPDETGDCPDHLRLFAHLQHLVVHDPSDVMNLTALPGLKSVTFVDADETFVDPSGLPPGCEFILHDSDAADTADTDATAPLPPLPRTHQRPRRVRPG
jgi:hypothetical protein